MRKRPDCKAAVGIFLGLMFTANIVWAAKSNTNFTIDTDETGIENFDKHLTGKNKREQDRPGFYSDDSTIIGLNEDGDPTVGMKF